MSLSFNATLFLCNQVHILLLKRPDEWGFQLLGIILFKTNYHFIYEHSQRSNNSIADMILKNEMDL